MSNELHLFSNGADIVSAADLADAMAVWEEQTCEDREDYPAMVFDPIPDERELALGEEGDDGPRETKTAREWAVSQGRVIVASSEW